MLWRGAHSEDSNSKLKEYEFSIEEERMQKLVLEHMKDSKYSDLKLVKKRVDTTRKIKDEFEKFVRKEEENLVADAKELDELRVMLVLWFLFLPNLVVYIYCCFFFVIELIYKSLRGESEDGG